MKKQVCYKIFKLLTLIIIFFYFERLQAEILSEHLSVITSADQQSNAVQSFIIIEEGKFIPQGIKQASIQQAISKQTPFVISYTKHIADNEQLQWQINVSDKQYGTLRLLTDFKGRGRMNKNGYQWLSDRLDASIKDRQRLVFRPKPFAHQPAIYKKGKGRSGDRAKYGGGTLSINDSKHNPQLSYEITLSVFQSEQITATHTATLQMDPRDMIRQEYINHFDIKRYGRGEDGNIPMPQRDEISEVPDKPDDLEGAPLTESEYNLMVNDGMLDLADIINKAYRQRINNLRSANTLMDLNKNSLRVPQAKLWITSGWRNPERNEWYSNAVNGIHQRGGAVDFIIMAPANSLESSVGYWVLWDALEQIKLDNVNPEAANPEQTNPEKVKQENASTTDHITHKQAYWQLETNGRPMTTREFTQDIEPLNGIPDAFDKADHLHANVYY